MSSLDFTGPRQLVEHLTMLDDCTIHADVAGYEDAALDEVTGALANPAPAEVYSGKCSIKPDDTLASPDEAGTLLTRYIVTVPHDVTGVREGQEVTVNASQDPDLVGAKLRVTAPEYKTLRVTRKIRCELETPSLQAE